MFCSDNQIMDSDLFQKVLNTFNYHKCSAVYPRMYYYKKDDNSLNRYFSLIGGNDPVCYYLGKNDREPHVPSLKRTSNYQPSYGCNGFFYREDLIKATNLEHYYPMDNALEVKGDFVRIWSDAIWHRTSDNLFTFIKKRYRYARDLYCNRNDRRWKIIDTREDYWKLFLFMFYSITIIQPFLVAIRGFKRIQDFSWFWHWPVCFAFLITYGVLTISWLLSVLSFQLSDAVHRIEIVWNLFGRKLIKITKLLK
jgi:hypothetical protein